MTYKATMIKIIITLFICSCCREINAQTCDCEKEFLFLKEQLENNYAGFRDKVKGNNKKKYEQLTSSLLQKARGVTAAHYCDGLQKEWISFFRDGHIQTGGETVKAVTDSSIIQQLFSQTERLPYKVNELHGKPGSIEGIYYTADSTYKIAVIKNKTAFRDYAGIILSSKTNAWVPGQVKLELKRLADGTYIAYAYNRDHAGYATIYSFDGMRLNNGTWIKAGAAQSGNTRTPAPPVGTARLSNKTFYLQISSFDPWNAAAIDSVIKSNEQNFKTIPYWILDLRGNGGGADFSYAPLMPYLYTGPVITTGVDVIASPANIKGWEKLLEDPELPATTKKAVSEMIVKMKSNTGGFVNIVPDDTLLPEEVKNYPQKIIILADRHCASSTEQFILAALQSKKVILAGQPTKGVLDYANMRDVNFPCSSRVLSYATTRSRRVDQGKGIDNKGIYPRIKLAEGRDWIKEALRILEN